MNEDNTSATSQMLPDRVKGCLFGVAIGDALGAPFEHLLPGQTNQALERIGGVIKDFQPHWNYPAGSWTDDTGMTLAGCHAFMDHATGGAKAQPLEACFRSRFREWVYSGKCRNPGKTVRYAAMFGEADIDSWANGALMRIAPVAIYSHLRGLNARETAVMAHEIAALTHGHPLATLPAVECVLTLRSIFQGEESSLRYPTLAGMEGWAAADILSPPEKIQTAWAAGVGFHKEYAALRDGPLECVPVSTGLWMWRHVMERVLGLQPGRPWLKLPSFEDGMIKAVNESIDRDTAGAVAGAILGAYWGYGKIPFRWASRVADAEEIIQLSCRFIRTVQFEKNGRGEERP